VPGDDGKRVFAIGQSMRGELERFDPQTKDFKPYLSRVSGVEPDFSRDGRWITYAAFPERTLWKMRVDGTERLQLTFPPISVIQPHWSPDGTRIALMGKTQDKPMRIYLVSSNGGTPVESNGHPGDEGVPTWSPAGRYIVFGDLLTGKPHSEMSIHVLDVAQDKVTELPESRGLWSPRWSPDGRYILAMTPDFQKLKLFNCQTRTWKDLFDAFNIDFPAWSQDSSHIFFKATPGFAAGTGVGPPSFFAACRAAPNFCQSNEFGAT